MKKLITIFIILGYLSPAFALCESDFMLNYLKTDLKINKEKIDTIDDFTAADLDLNLKIKNIDIDNEKDELINYLNSNLKISPKINDDITDELIKNLKAGEIKKKNYAKIENVKISPKSYYSTRSKLKEGDFLDFILSDDIIINSDTYPKGTIIKGRIENISQNATWGTPADIVIDNFKINDDIYIDGSITKQGANRSIWVYPISYSLSFFFGIGIFFIAIRGGHAKLKPKQVYIIGD